MASKAAGEVVKRGVGMLTLVSQTLTSRANGDLKVFDISLALASRGFASLSKPSTSGSAGFRGAWSAEMGAERALAAMRQPAWPPLAWSGSKEILREGKVAWGLSVTSQQRGVTSQVADDTFEAVDSSELLETQNNVSAVPQGQVFENYVPVNAYYLSKDIHIDRLSESALFGGLEQNSRNDQVTINVTPLCRPAKQSIMTFSTSDSDGVSGGVEGAFEGDTNGNASEVAEVVNHTFHQSSFVVAFRYGSVVFFNVEDDLIRDRYLKELGAYSSASFRTPKAEDFSVVVDQRQRQWSSLSLDHLKLRCLDMNNIVVISSVLGQSVALDHYHTQVDSMLMQFTKINQEMEQTGKFNMERKALFQLVAQNNTTYSDSLTKIKLLEKPSEAAWKYAHYGAIWEQLRMEFELEERFQRLSLKLELMEKNVKYFLEILQNRKSDTLEWIIIILIAGEIILCLYDIYDRAQEKKRLQEEKRSSTTSQHGKLGLDLEP